MLSVMGPNNQGLGFRQSGRSIVTLTRLPEIWKKYKANELTAIKAKEELEEGNTESKNEY